MKTENIRVKLRDGKMGAYLAIPDRTPAGGIIAIMEIWGVNDTMRHHAHEFALRFVHRGLSRRPMRLTQSQTNQSLRTAH